MEILKKLDDLISKVDERISELNDSDSDFPIEETKRGEKQIKVKKQIKK